MSVPIDGRAVGDAKFADECFRALPAEEGFVNGGAVWMAANIAPNAVVGESGASGTRRSIPLIRHLLLGLCGGSPFGLNHCPSLSTGRIYRPTKYTTGSIISW